jgi:DNA/RNA endonuclease YhcR with UshA esterase domain
MALSALRWASVALAVVGVAVLLILAGRSRVPVVRIGDLAPAMNWAYLRVEGIVSRQPAVDPESGALKLWLRDETGEVLAMAYRPEAEALRAAGRLPVMGDGLALEGTLRVREEFYTLVINLPDKVEIRPAEAVPLAIEQVHAGPTALAGQKVRLRGAVRGVRSPYEGLLILKLRDETAAIEVVLPPASDDAAAFLPRLVPGQSLEVAGAVDLYGATPQVSVGRWSDLALLEGEVTIAPPRRAGELAAGDEGRWARLKGTIAEARSFSAGLKLALDDGSGRVTVLLWQDLLRSLPAADLAEGATLEVQGQVAEYRGELEIVPELASDLLLLLPPAPRKVIARTVGELSAGHVGQVVQVEGVLLSLRAFSAGRKGLLDDGTGAVTLLLWQDVYDGLSDPGQVQPGARLRVEGEVAEYGGALEVVPLTPAGVAVLGHTALEIPEMAVGQIQAEDAGQTVQVAGQVMAVHPFSRGLRLTLDDGTGEITLLLWQEVLAALQGSQAPALGARVTARGEIAQYGGALEIIPPSADALQIEATVPTSSPSLVPPSATATATPATPPAGTQATPKPAAPAPTVATGTPPPARTIGSLGSTDLGSEVTLARAGIAEVIYFSKGIQYRLTDATGSIILLLWQNVLEKAPQRLDLYPGSQVRVSGQIQEYQGSLEIVPQNAAGVVVVTPGSRPPVEERSLATITPSDEGRVFVVTGTVTRAQDRGYLRLWINDGSGEMLVYLPERLIPYLPPDLGPGVRLAVTGEVDIYQGVLEIIPLAGADVVRR